jgi:hypothetical protein
MPGQQRKGVKTSNPDDLLKLVERIIEGAESEGEKSVTLKTWVARAMLESAKRGAKEGSGRKAIGVRAKVTESVIIIRARQRKADLVAHGMPKEQAADQAAKEASDAFGKRRNLAASTIKRMMQRRC